MSSAPSASRTRVMAWPGISSPRQSSPSLAGQIIHQHGGANAIESSVVQHAAEIAVGQIVAAVEHPLVQELEDRLDLFGAACRPSVAELRNWSTSAAAFCW